MDTCQQIGAIISNFELKHLKTLVKKAAPFIPNKSYKNTYQYGTPDL